MLGRTQRLKAIGPRLRPAPSMTVVALSALLLAACAGATRDNSTTKSDAPQQAFLSAIARHCGQAFAGRVLVDTPPSANNPFAEQALIMHVRECSADSIRIPFHVGTNRSRTWVLTRTTNGLRLKHDHRHEDGSADAVTMYGGDSATPGTAVRQSFPVDAESIATFRANGLTASVENTWAMEIEPGRRFVYELSRPNGRLFRVEFDLSRPVTAPPAPWGTAATSH